MIRNRPIQRLLGLLLWAGASVAQAAPAAISIVIDDIGYQREAGERALRLPGAVAYAVLPFTPFGVEQAARARQGGAEILLHLPLEAQRGVLHPAAIRLDDDRAELVRRLHDALIFLPNIDGINNHQGSLVTSSPREMAWLMEEIRKLGGLYFVDSRTSAMSVAQASAERAGVPTTRRNVFLDDTPGYEAAAHQFQRLIAHARRHGSALAIGHPRPDTLRLLEAELPRLSDHGVRLVPPSELIRLQQQAPAEPPVLVRTKSESATTGLERSLRLAR